MDLDSLRLRILQISKEKKLSHIGSCLSVLPLLCKIYENKDSKDLVILDNAHAHLAHLVVQEAVYDNDFEAKLLIDTYGIHCDRSAGCDASGGSLGHGVGIGIGMALIDRSRTVHVVVSDGSMMEGSNWEALRIKASLGLDNLKIYVNFNGYSAVAPVDFYELQQRMNAFCKDVEFSKSSNGEGFEGLAGHYKTI